MLAAMVCPAAAFDYQLISVPLVATEGLDLTNAADPLYTDPGTGVLENFRFEWARSG
jgi:hypothetical protein